MQNNKALNLMLNAGAPASAVPRTWFLFVNNVLKYLTIRNGRLLVNNDKWTIECIGSSTIKHDFVVTKEINEDGDPIIKVKEGYISAYNTLNEGFVFVDAEEFPYVDGHSVYFQWNNSTPEEQGSWEEGEKGKLLYGELPAQDIAKQIVWIAQINDSEGVAYHHIGMVKIYDIRSQCQ